MLFRSYVPSERTTEMVLPDKSYLLRNCTHVLCRGRGKEPRDFSQQVVTWMRSSSWNTQVHSRTILPSASRHLRRILRGASKRPIFWPLDYQAGQREGVALRPFSVSQRPATPVAQGLLSFCTISERSETFIANSKKVGNLA